MNDRRIVPPEAIVHVQLASLAYGAGPSDITPALVPLDGSHRHPPEHVTRPVELSKRVSAVGAGVVVVVRVGVVVAVVLVVLVVTVGVVVVLVVRVVVVVPVGVAVVLVVRVVKLILSVNRVTLPERSLEFGSSDCL